MASRRFLAILAFTIVIALIGSTLFAGFYTELLWFENLGLRSVFTAMLVSRLGLGLVVGLIFGLFILMNLLVVFKSRQVPFRAMGSVFEAVPLPRNVKAFLVGISAVLGLLTGIGASGNWMIVRQYLARSAFGLQDPFFQQDIGFYLFSLPFFSLVYQLAFSLLTITAALVGVYYLVTGFVAWTGRLSLHPPARTHLFVLIAAMLFLKAFGYRLAIYNLLYSPRGVTFGASYTDINAQPPALRILMAVSIVAAILTLLNVRSWRFSWIGAGLALLLASSILIGGIYPGIVQQFQVSPDEISKETPYILENIKHTNIAYGLDGIVERSYPAESVADLGTVLAYGETLDNVRFWDPRVLQDTFSQIQEIRLYYKFHDVDVSRFQIDQRLQQVFMSAREINKANLPESARTWINLHLKFTHGYGLVMSPASEVSPDGLPVFLVKDLPPKVKGGIEVTRPEIYYGELTDDYVVVNTRETEFDYPLGDSNALTHYEGTGGIRIGNWMNRILLAMNLGSYRLLFTDAITPDSRVMIHREITDRTRRIAPFLHYDSDPYLAISDEGRLFWIIDAYTVSDAFPYSEPYRGYFNYIRNSVKAVVDAYEGTVDYYIFDEEDPVLKTYERIFPGLFRPREEMPLGLEDQVRYPVDLYKIQAEMLSTYHMKDAGLFYNREDQWNVPNETYAGNVQVMEPYYVIMKLPGEEKPEFILMLPFTPAEKQNMVAWLGARSNPENYGELLLFKFPKDRLVFGPMQVEARIDQDPVISEQTTLWGQVGSNVIRGNLLVIPINTSIMYIEPLYLQSTGSSIPEFRRVIVAYGDRIVMERDLESALAVLFEGVPGKEIEQPAEDALTVSDLIERAVRLFKEAEAHAREGNWAEYGRALGELGRALEGLEGIMDGDASPD